MPYLKIGSLWSNSVTRASKRLKDSALFDCGTWWEAPLTVTKITLENICWKPECCLSVNQGVLSYTKITWYMTQPSSIALCLSKYLQKVPLHPNFHCKGQSGFFFKLHRDLSDIYRTPVTHLDQFYRWCFKRKVHSIVDLWILRGILSHWDWSNQKFHQNKHRELH